MSNLPTPAVFQTTQWSVLAEAASSNSPGAEHALDELCRNYWYPLYAFVRRQGYPPDEAEDLTQEFFLHLFQKSVLTLASSSRGRFRTFLIHALKNFLANQWRRGQRQKRGGGRRILSFDVDAAEGRYRQEPVDGCTPEALYERKWAKALLNHVLDRLRDSFQAAGQSDRYEVFKTVLVPRADGTGYATLAARLGMREPAFKTAVSRFRQRYRELLRQEVAVLVDDPRDVDDEINHIIATLGGKER